MNFLGHAYLSFNDDEILVGNMIGDHIKGMLVLEKYPEKIKKGILLHRKIDEFADLHPATIKAKLLFRSHYGRYSGAIMDTLYDHFLANDSKYFSSEQDLLSFTNETYRKLEDKREFQPFVFSSYFPNMVKQNWLYNFRTPYGIKKSLQGLQHRALYMPGIDKAFEIFICNYYVLNQYYFDFIGDVVKFVKTEQSN